MLSHQLTHLTGADTDALFSSEEFSPPGDPEKLHHSLRMVDTRSCSGTSDIFFPAKTIALFNEQIAVQPGLPDDRQTCFELVLSGGRRHIRLGKYDESGNNIYGEQNIRAGLVEPSLTSKNKSEGCVFDVESN